MELIVEILTKVRGLRRPWGFYHARQTRMNSFLSSTLINRLIPLPPRETLICALILSGAM